MRDAGVTNPTSAALLSWYDRHARVLPWRVGPAERAGGVWPDPYLVWLSEIMLQQTTVATVRDYFHRFSESWPTVRDLAAAEDAEVMAAWAGLGYYARARNLLKCARTVVSDHNGHFPETDAELRRLPGIGPYTAAAIAAIAFDRPETVVDGNVERVMSRIFAVTTPLPDAKKELTALAGGLTPVLRPGDYAQAVMDLGATVCTPKNPTCSLCPWRPDCRAHAEGLQTQLPNKRAKSAKPTRRGFVYLVRRNDGAWLLERRPDKGLLGGMLGWPTSDWTAAPQEAPPLRASWTSLDAEVRHTFTHFRLRLALRVTITDGQEPERGEFQPAEIFRPDSLPTAMRKAYDLSKHWFDAN